MKGHGRDLIRRKPPVLGLVARLILDVEGHFAALGGALVGQWEKGDEDEHVHKYFNNQGHPCSRAALPTYKVAIVGSRGTWCLEITNVSKNTPDVGQ